MFQKKKVYKVPLQSAAAKAGQEKHQAA